MRRQNMSQLRTMPQTGNRLNPSIQKRVDNPEHNLPLKLNSDIIDHKYVNVFINGGTDSSNPTGYVLAQYQNTFNYDILKNSDMYHLTISKLTFDNKFIPNMIMYVQTGQTDINLSTYSFTYQYNDISNYQEYLIYTPQNNYILPPPPIVTQSITPYYYINNMLHFQKMLNQTLQTSYQNMFNDNTIALSGLGYTIDDYARFFWDEINEVFLLAYPKIYVSQPVIKLFCNKDLKFDVMGPFDFYDYYGTTVNGCDFQYLFYDDNNEYDVDNFFSKQTYKYTPVSVYPISEIILESNSLETENESIDVQLANTQNDTNETPIIFDLSPLVENFSDANKLIYVPSLYRLIDINSNKSIRSLNVTVKILDKKNNLLDVYLPPNCQVQIKFLFLKKNITSDSALSS